MPRRTPVRWSRNLEISLIAEQPSALLFGPGVKLFSCLRQFLSSQIHLKTPSSLLQNSPSSERGLLLNHPFSRLHLTFIIAVDRVSHHTIIHLLTVCEACHDWAAFGSGALQAVHLMKKIVLNKYSKPRLTRIRFDRRFYPV